MVHKENWRFPVYVFEVLRSPIKILDSFFKTSWFHRWHRKCLLSSSGEDSPSPMGQTLTLWPQTGIAITVQHDNKAIANGNYLYQLLSIGQQRGTRYAQSRLWKWGILAEKTKTNQAKPFSLIDRFKCERYLIFTPLDLEWSACENAVF